MQKEAGRGEKPSIIGMRFYKVHKKILKQSKRILGMESQAAVNRYAVEKLGETLGIK